MKITRIADSKYGEKVLIDSDYDDKEAIKSLDFDTTHRSWNGGISMWTADADDETLDALRDIGCEIPDWAESYIEGEDEDVSKIDDIEQVIVEQDGDNWTARVKGRRKIGGHVTDGGRNEIEVNLDADTEDAAVEEIADQLGIDDPRPISTPSNSRLGFIEE